jgi:serine/threonine-protein kinase
MTPPLERVRSALAPRYLIERELGAGGMAVVYLARDSRHDRLVAIKVLRSDLAAALGPERFQREIGIAARLRHPNIVPLYDSGEADGLFYFVMPYVEGESLRTRLDREGQLPVADAVAIAREVADALAHASGHQLIHRDIKPDNILLEGGHALVADFGIARAIGSAAATQLTATGLSVGTPAYMSPEQALAEESVDARSDVYSLGCVLYEMLAGEPPYAARTAQASIAKRLSEPAPRIRHVRDSVPAHVEQAILTALARAPADRFRSAAAFRDALAGAVAPPAAAPKRAPRRNMLIAAAVLAALAGTAVALPRIVRPRSDNATVAPSAVPGVAVLPFRAVGADPELWHEGIVDMLAHNLDGLGQLRRIDPVAVLTAWRRMGGSPEAALSADDAREVGRRLGGRYVVTGQAVQVGADVQLIAEVHDVATGEMRGTVRVTRPADSATALVDELTVELLRQSLLPTDSAYAAPNLSRVTTSSLPALKAYLAGEREYRTANWIGAVRHYRRAVEADSNFASAWFRMASACGWEGCTPSLVTEYAGRAAQLQSRLPDRDRRLLRIRQAGDLRALEALRDAYPDDVEVWATLGDFYYHFGSVLLAPTDASRGALTKAVELHPHYGEAYLHLIEDAFLRLDSADARRYIDGYVALGGHHPCTYEVSYDLVWGAAPASRRALAVLDTVNLLQCTQAPMAAPAEALDRMAGFYSVVADTASDHFDRKFGLWRMLQVRVPNGQVAAARQALARLDGKPQTGRSAARWKLQLHLSGFPDPAGPGRAARVMASDAEPTDHFWLGALAVEEGRWADVEAVRRALEQQVASLGGDQERGTPGADASAYSAALGAWARLVRNDRGGLGELEAALARLPLFNLDIEMPQQYLRYRVGKLLFDAGRPREAERYFRSFQPYDYFYTTQAELYLARIAEGDGRRAEAAERYGRFLRWWQMADAPLQPLTDEARQALRRLAGAE